MLPPLCNILGEDNPLVHCIRAYQQYCIMVSMKVMTTDRLERLRHYMLTYEHYCKVKYFYIKEVPVLNVRTACYCSTHALEELELPKTAHPNPCLR
jgi:hypothetical protein